MTDWVGWSDRKGTHWEKDLTPSGRNLMTALRLLYRGHQIVLTTQLES